MPPIEPARNRRPTQRHWLSKSRNAASFGRGVRWLWFSTRTIDWSVAMSLPLGLMTVLLLVAVPIFLSTDFLSSDATLESLGVSCVLVAVWAMGLLGQSLIVMGWLGRRRSSGGTGNPELGGLPPTEVVTLTIGGVWTAVPSEELDLEDPEPVNPSAADRRSLTGAVRVVAIWASVMVALVVAASICLVADGRLESGVDRPWMEAAWMFVLQAIWQLLPLPQSLGRVGWSVVLGWLTPALPSSEPARRDSLPPWALLDPAERRDATIGPDALRSTRRVRWWILGFAFSTLVVGALAIRLAGLTTASGVEPFPVFAGVVLLSMWLFASSRNEDLFAIALTLSENGEIGRLADTLHPVAAWRKMCELKSQRERTTRLKAAVAAEHSEANDAARVDDILQRLHEQGQESLSREERALLQRVSEAIRRQRSRP